METGAGDGAVGAPEQDVRYRWAAELCAGKRVLDAGCGTGRSTAVLAGATTAIGVDLSPTSIEEARRAHGDRAEFHEGDLRALPFGDGEFDCVVCFEALAHVAGPETALGELCRALRGGGLLLVSAPDRAAYPPGNPLHQNELGGDEVAEMLRARLANVAVHPLGAAQAIVAASDAELPAPPAWPARGEDAQGDEQRRELAERRERVRREAEGETLRRRLGPAPPLERRPTVSVVVPNRDGAAHLRRLLAGLAERTSYDEMELILVDNGSSDDSVELARRAEAPFPISILANPHNESFSDACNQGAEAARGDLLLFLNNDIEPLEPG